METDRASAGSPGAASVLVVDDEPLVRWALRERLTHDGCQVTEAGTVEEALGRVSADLDLVLLDIRLPDGDGRAVMGRIRERAPSTLVILMTAFSGATDVGEAASLGAWDLLSKPFNLDEISAAVARAVEIGRLRRRLYAASGLGEPSG